MRQNQQINHNKKTRTPLPPKWARPTTWIWRDPCVGLARPKHGQRSKRPVRASSSKRHRGSSASSSSLFHDFLSLPPEIWSPISNAQNPFLKPQKSFLMPQKLFLDSNLKPRKGRLTLRRFYHPNAEKNDSGVGEDDSTARPTGWL